MSAARGMLGLALVALVASSSSASTDLRLGVGVGAVGFDSSLRGFHWETDPRPAPEAELTLARGRWETGFRVRTTSTEQAFGFAATPQAARIRWTSAEILTRVRIAQWGPLELSPALGVGRVDLRYDPDYVSITLSPAEGYASRGEARVRLAPIDEWLATGSLQTRLNLAPSLALAIAAERSLFRLDTAERSDDGVVEDRRTFGAWSLRAQFVARFSLAR